MTTSLFNATLALAEELGVLRTSTATGGSTTTVVDSTRTEEDDNFNDGTVWIITDGGGASAAPEGEWGRVLDFANASNTFTIDTLSAAVASGDFYGFTTGRYPLDVLIAAINRQLVRYKMKRYDATSLDIVANQTEYTLPAGITGDNLIGVYESTVDDTDDNQWVELNFDVQEAATGSQHTLIIESREVGVGNDILLEYYTWHPRIYNADDNIDGDIPLPLLLPAAAAHCELLRMRTYGSESKLDIDMLQFHRSEAAKAEARYPMRYKTRRGNVNEAGRSYSRTARVEPPAKP